MEKKGNFFVSRPFFVGLSSAYFFFYSIIQLSLFNSIGTFLVDELKTSSVEWANLSSLYFYALALIVLPAGYALDQFSSRSIALSIALLSTVSILFFTWSQTILTVSLYRFIGGIVNGFSFLILLRVSSYWFPNKSAIATGVMIAFGVSGGLFSNIVFSNIANYFGWHTSLWINFYMGLLLCFLLWRSFYDHIDEKSSIESQKNIMYQLKTVIQNFHNFYCGLYIGLVNLFIYILGAAWGNIYLTERYSIDNSQASFTIAMLFLGFIVGSPTWSIWSDKLQKRKSLMITGTIFLALTATYEIFIKSESTIMLNVLFLMMGFFCAVQVLGYPIIYESNKKSLISTATGFSLLVINVIGGISQIIFGWLFPLSLYSAKALGERSVVISNSENTLIVLVIACILAIIFTLQLDIHDR